ncbi:MAG: hypothetical protein ACRC6M_14500 [Microcystaceae cyanobacterium]
MLQNSPQKLLGILSLLALCLTASVSYAQSLRVTPLVVQIQAEQGQARGLVEFGNTGNEALRARIYTVPFTYNREGFKKLESSPNDLTPYLTLSPRELVIEPNQTRTVRLNARFAPSVPDGEYRVLMYAEPLQERDPANPSSNISIKTRLGIAVYVTKGELVPIIQVGQVDYSPENKQIRLLVSNKGAVTVRPRANWQLAQEKREKAKGQLDETTIIAGGDRYLTIPYPPQGQALKAGNYQLSGQLKWSFPQAGSLNFDVPLTISEQETRNKK